MRCSVEPQCNTERSRATSHSCSWVTSRFVKSRKNNFSLQHNSLDCNLIPLLCNINFIRALVAFSMCLEARHPGSVTSWKTSTPHVCYKWKVGSLTWWQYTLYWSYPSSQKISSTSTAFSAPPASPAWSSITSCQSRIFWLKSAPPLTCTGKRTVRVKEVPTQASSLTQGDVYILDAGLLIYIFCGPTANMFEKSKGT